MPKIRITRGSFRRASGERAEPGDVIDVDDDTLERLNNPSYELVEGGVDPTDEPVAEPEPDEPDKNTPTADTEPDNSTSPETEVSPEPVSTEAEDEAESDEDDEAESEDQSMPEPADTPDEDAPDGADSADIGDQTPTPDVPDDYSMLSKMAAIYEGDEIHGSMSGDQITDFLEGLTPTEVNGLKRQAKQEMGG